MLILLNLIPICEGGVCVCVQSCLALCGYMDWSLPGSSVNGNFRQEYWSGLRVSICYSRGSSRPMDRTLTLLQWQVDFFFTTEPPGKPQYVRYFVAKLFLFCILRSLPFPLVFTICLKTCSFLQLERNCLSYCFLSQPLCFSSPLHHQWEAFISRSQWHRNNLVHMRLHLITVTKNSFSIST